MEKNLTRVFDEMSELTGTILKEAAQSNLVGGKTGAGDLPNATGKMVNPGNLELPGDSAVDKPKDSGWNTPDVQKKVTPAPKSKLTPSKKNESVEEDRPLLSFDELYAKTITEEDDLGGDEGITDVVPADDIEGASFDDESGDFDPADETDVDEEVDVSTELRLLADRLTEIADKIGGLEGDEDMGEEGMEGEDLGEEGLEDVGDEGMGGGEGLPPGGGMRESHAPTALKKASKSKFSPKMKNTASNIKKQVGAAKTSVSSKDRSGKLSPAPKSTLGPGTPLAVKGGSGPAMKGGNDKLFG